jgi:hypothetical protein
MLVRLTTSIAGPGFALYPGDEREFPDAEAIRFIEAGYAVPLGEHVIETATIEPPIERRRGRKPSKR